MKPLKSITALGAFFVVAVLLSSCGSAIPGNSVAVMAGNPITMASFNHWMYIAAKGNASQAPGAPVIVPDPPDYNRCVATVRQQVPTLAKTPTKQLKTDCGQLFTALSTQVMDFLIRASWYQAEAARQHVTVSDAEVQKAFNTAKNQAYPNAAQFQAFLQQSGQTLEDILFRVRVNQLYRKLISKHNSSVTNAQIQAYYNSHLSQFGTPETRNIRIILAKTQADAAAAKAALASGQSWNAVAKKYSNDPTSKSSGGLLVGVKKGQEDKALDTAAFSASENKLLGPVHGTFGYYVFEVTKVKKGTQQTLAQATPLIRSTLVGQAQTNAQTAVDAQARKYWLTKTLCRKLYAMANCSGYKAPKTSTTPSATTPPSTTR